MRRTALVIALAPSTAALAACGSGTGDRALSGGALTNSNQVDLGKRLWK